MRVGSRASHHLRPLLAAVLPVALGLVAPTAHAEVARAELARAEVPHADGVTPVARNDGSPAAAAVATEPPPTDVTVGLGVGAMTEGALVETSVLVRLHHIDLGFDAGGGGLFIGLASVGALAGVGFRSPSGVRFDLLANAGVRSYSGWGGNFLSDDPGASATLPYAGGKFRLSYLFGHRKGHFTLGGEFGVDTDLGRKRVQYDYQETDFLFDDGTSIQHGDQTVGGTRATFVVLLGGTIDMGR